MQPADKIRWGRRSANSARFLGLLAVAGLLLGGGRGWADPGEGRRQADQLYDQWRQGLEAQLLGNDLGGDPGALARWLVPRLEDRRYLFVPFGEPPDPATRSEQLDRLLRAQAAGLFTLAGQVADQAPGRSYRWMHEVLFLDPDHGEARRILGHRRVGGVWRVGSEPRSVLARRPFPLLGWPAGRYWEVSSKHFRIRTNASRQAGEALAEQLELVHNVWQQLFFGFWSDAEQLSRHWERPGRAWIRHAPLEVILFADRREYLEKLRPYESRIDVTLGYYAPQRGTAFFYAGDPSLRRTWWHEAVHQLFDQYRRGGGSLRTDSLFGMVEGVAMYMESMQLYPGYVTLGGLEAPRLQSARQRALTEGFHVPVSRLLAMGREEWQGDPDIRALYSQAAGLAHLLLDRRRVDDELALETMLTYVYQGEAVDERGLRKAMVGWQADYREFLQVGDDQLRRALAVSRPRQLALGGTHVTDAGLVALSSLESLQWLDLSGTRVTDRGVGHLAGLGGLEHLGLAGTAVTDRSLAILARMEGLQSVSLSGSQVTAHGLAWLAQQRPGLEVLEP